MKAEAQERILHWCILGAFLLNAIWVLWIPCFPTLDGWSHLHTARMLFEGAPADIYCPNPGSVPNRVGHLLLGALQVVLPALVAERTLLALIVFGTGAGVWRLARSFGQASPMVLLVLPFTVNFMLVLGFHNFLLGVALALLMAASWIAAKRSSWLGLVGLMAASILLYYTHTTALAFFLMLVAAHELNVLFVRVRREQAIPGGPWAGAFAVLAACLPAILLFLDFNAAQNAHWGAVDRGANLRDLFDLRSIVLYNYQAEEKFTYCIKLLLVASALVAGIARWRAHRSSFAPNDSLLLLAMLLLVLYFVLPDSSGYASYITVRLQWMSLLLFLAWVATQELNAWTTVPMVVIALLAHQARNGYISEAMAPIAERCEQVLEAAAHVPEKSVVLPVLTEENWLLGHMPSLLAVDRDINLLDNYECGTGYFPYVWCPTLPEPIRRHASGTDKCLAWLEEHLNSDRPPAIDHIVLVGAAPYASGCEAQNLRNVLQRYFKRSYTNGHARVYERR